MKSIFCFKIQLSGLPLCERMKQSSVFFVGASEKVEIMDLGQLVVDNILECERFDLFCWVLYNSLSVVKVLFQNSLFHEDKSVN